MCYKPVPVVFAVFTAHLAVSFIARADGGFFVHETTATDLTQARQEALLAVQADQVTCVLRTLYQGQAAEFAWVIPVPAVPTEVTAHQDARLFAELRSGTEPSFDILFGGGGGCACGGGAGGAQGGLVTVEARGQAGIYDWYVLTGSGGLTLLGWLQSHQFVVSDTARPVLEGYIQQGMRFLAVRVREPQSLPGGILKDAPPIQFNLATTRRYYPMAISQISAAPETEVILYTLAAHRQQAANQPNGLIDPATVRYDPASESLTSYERVFGEEIARLGGVAFMTEYASPARVGGTFTASSALTFVLLPADWPAAPPGLTGQNLFLTRLRTLIPRDRMDFDLELQDAAADTIVNSVFSVNSQAVATARALAPMMAACLSFAAAVTLLRRSYRLGLSRDGRNRSGRASLGEAHDV